jgi:hypothetical protein
VVACANASQILRIGGAAMSRETLTETRLMLKQNYMLEPASFPATGTLLCLHEVDGRTQIRLFDKH